MAHVRTRSPCRVLVPPSANDPNAALGPTRADVAYTSAVPPDEVAARARQEPMSARVLGVLICEMAESDTAEELGIAVRRPSVMLRERKVF